MSGRTLCELESWGATYPPRTPGFEGGPVLADPRKVEIADLTLVTDF